MHKTMAEEGRMAKEGDRKPGNMTAIHDKLLYAERVKKGGGGSRPEAVHLTFPGTTAVTCH